MVLKNEGVFFMGQATQVWLASVLFRLAEFEASNLFYFCILSLR